MSNINPVNYKNLLKISIDKINNDNEILKLCHISWNFAKFRQMFIKIDSKNDEFDSKIAHFAMHKKSSFLTNVC